MFQGSHLSRRFRYNRYCWRMHRRRREHRWEINRSQNLKLHTLEQQRNNDRNISLIQQQALVQHQAPVQQSAPEQPPAQVQYPAPVQLPAPVQRRDNERHQNPEEYEYNREEEIYREFALQTISSRCHECICCNDTSEGHVPSRIHLCPTVLTSPHRTSLHKTHLTPPHLTTHM